MVVKFFSLILFAVLLVSNAVAREEWRVFSDPFPIRDAISFSEGVLLATDGGIRYRTPKGDYVFHSENGLETSSFYSIVSSDLGVFAVSEFGQVNALAEGGKTWIVVNRSFVKNNARAVPGATVLAKGVLTIAFEDRLAFLNVFDGTSILTIDRIGNRSLSVDRISRVVAHEDSLYVRLGKDVFVRVMDWDNLSRDNRLSDPASWSQVTKPESLSDLAVRDSVWIVDGASGKYEVGAESIKLLSGKKKEDLTHYDYFELGEVYELRNIPIGGVMGASVDGKLSFTDNKEYWSPAKYVYNGFGSLTSSYSARMKVLSLLPDGHVFFHIWGLGYFIYSQWGAEKEHSFYPHEGLCLDNYENNYSVAVASTPAPDGSGFLTATASNQGYSIVYFTKDGEIHCAKNIGSAPVSGPMYAKIDDDGSWVIYMGTKDGTSLANEGGLDVIRFPAPKTNGNELSNQTIKSIGGIYPAPVDIAYDSVSEHLWLVSMSALAYYDEDNDTLTSPKSTSGLLGAEYTSIEADVHGNLWLGTANQGVFRLTRKGKSLDTLSVIQYTAKNGLLSNSVADVAIDPVQGAAWFAHDKGVSAYFRSDLKSAKQNMTDSAKFDVAAYPIPFRPKVHHLFVIENISESASVFIYNRGGALVRSFRNDDILGGRVEWDGCGKDGRLVAPGVYYYMVKNSSKTKKGKFIVIH